MTFRFRLISFVIATGILAGCSGERAPPPQPASRPQPRPVAVPPPRLPAPAPTATDWADLPLTPGNWTYDGPSSTSSATYGSLGANGSGARPVFRVYCEGPTRSVFLQRFGATTARSMTVRTSFGARTLTLDPGPDLASATLTARDPFLDTMIFSRGRFSVEVPGSPMLVLPSWAEAARVVEDCRRF